MTLDQWLAIATRHLAQGSVERVRAEIQEHAAEAQADGADAVAALGDPRAANREYRKVLLTTTEEAMAPAITRPQPLTPARVATFLLPLAALGFFMSSKRGFSWPVLLAIWSTAPLQLLFPPNTRERNRIHIYAHTARTILAASVAWWYQGWANAASLAALLAILDYVVLRNRTSIFRKLAAGQLVLPFPGEPGLTHYEAILLNTLRNGEPYRAVSLTVLFGMLAGLSWWLPLTFGPLFASMAIIFAARWLPIYTPFRSQCYRIGKWGLEIAASLLPVYLAAPAPWTTAALYTFVLVMFDWKRIALRRKLPVAEWPRDLYV